MARIISVFGSSQPQPGTPRFTEAEAVGRLLAKNGFAVATGGYGGTMTAVSQGAARAGGHVIGITSTIIEQYRGIGPNPYVREEIKYDSLQERLLHLVRHNDGMIVLPGGIGTLSEMALAWSLLQVSEIPPRPFALLGPTWRETVETFFQPQFVKEKDLGLLYFADGPETAVAHIVSTLQAGADA